MKRELILVVFAVFLLAGCSNEKTETVAVDKAPPVKTAEEAAQTMTETTQAVQEKVQQTADQVVEKVGEVKAEAEKVVQQTTDKVAALADSLDAGKAVYQASCNSCHGSGIMGAPKLGDERLKSDVETLVKNSIKGIGRMPARGGVASLSDEQVRSAVEYMVSQGK